MERWRRGDLYHSIDYGSTIIEVINYQLVQAQMTQLIIGKLEGNRPIR